MISSQLHFTTAYPKLNKKSVIVIYDQKLARNSKLKTWLGSFQKRIPVKAGETLKDLDHFPHHVKKLIKLADCENIRELKIVAVGGGSVGDFAGFLASVLKRGVQLVHVPSTWLAAMDSAHGGKTALNVGVYKNQIGSFYPATEVYISKAILMSQKSTQLKSAYGELFKIALINGGILSKKVLGLNNLDAHSMWSLLPLAVKAKLKVVNQDPFEKRKIRYKLNLGHTFGHALELGLGLSHGEAVLIGTDFALRWSRHKNILSEKKYNEIHSKMLYKSRPKSKLVASQLKKALSQDKKFSDSSKLHFVFVKKAGECPLKQVKVSEIIKEAKRQGWV